MDLSGIIFVVLAVAWAVYLVPKALKHHDEVARTRSIDRFSQTMRVLARREPVSTPTGSGTGRRDSRLVVSPARTADNPRVLAPGSRPVEPVGTSADPRRTPPRAQRAAARAAARRRRRILSFLLLATLVVTGLAAFAVVPPWAVSIPAGLTLLYLVLCRTQVRHDRDTAWLAEIEAAAEEDQQVEAVTPRAAARVEAPYGAPLTPAARNAQGFAEVEADDDTHEMPAVVDAVMVPTEDGGSLWDPLPVTLPTYVSKPKAKRTVRTITLEDEDTWSSGRSAEDSQLVADNPAAPAASAPDEPTAGEPEIEQRAVGT